jgi:hypothetical protein
VIITSTPGWKLFTLEWNFYTEACYEIGSKLKVLFDFDFDWSTGHSYFSEKQGCQIFLPTREKYTK